MRKTSLIQLDQFRNSPFRPIFSLRFRPAVWWGAVLKMALLICFIPVGIMAADPIIGTWKTDLEKSSFPADQQGIKEDINTYREIEGGLIELSIKTINPDDSLYTALWRWPKQGGIAEVLSRAPGEGITYVQTYIEPGHWCVNIMENGKQIARYHKIVSKDGRTMKQTLIGSKDGKPITVIKVLEKQ